MWVLEQSVLLSAATIYMNYLRDAATVEVQKSNVRVLEETLKQTRDRFNVGEVTRTGSLSQTTLRTSSGSANRSIPAITASQAKAASLCRSIPSRTDGDQHSSRHCAGDRSRDRNNTREKIPARGYAAAEYVYRTAFCSRRSKGSERPVLDPTQRWHRGHSRRRDLATDQQSMDRKVAFRWAVV
jgi:hypothetical protein